MIVISGALVLVALVLLVLGLTMTDLNFVYGSIAVSLISFVFLVIGILQRRGEQPAEAGATAAGPAVTEDADAATAVAPVALAKTGATGSVPVAGVDRSDDEAYDAQGYEDDVAGGAGGATVLVVPGRPRYHVDGCRYLTGKDVEEVGVEEARSQYSPCGVCKPDAVLAAEAAPVEEDLGDTGVPGTDEVVEEPPAPRRRSGSTRTTAGTRGARKAPARSPRTTGAATAATGVGTVDPVVEEPAPGGPVVPAKSTARRKVVVIPDRARFHTPDCRFVRDALGTEELSRSAATKQGYQACGVCKP